MSRNRRPFPRADRSRDGVLYEQMHPRLAAIRLLREKIVDKKAGLDPYDRRIFIIELGPNETKWGTISTCLAGWPVNRLEREDGSVRLYAVLEADAREELGCDGANPPLMQDEPLASRGIDAPGAAMDAILEVLPEVSPLLTLVSDPEPVSRAAIEAAKAAYDRRGPDQDGKI